MKKIISVVLSLVFVLGIFPAVGFAATNTEDIIILYENDVHCEVVGYSKLAAMKKEFQKTHAYVGVVSGGDYIQGSSLGVISKGEYIVNLMNLVGYDAVALGNHEFDYRMERLEELIGMMDTAPVCCNFQRIGEAGSYFKPYSIVSYGDVDIAYIGITTPSTITSSSPAQFKDSEGNFAYTFHATDLYEVVQTNIDAAKAEGADYIIAVSHIGYADDEIYGDMEDVETLIQNTDGLDVVLDAHSHSVIEGIEIIDKGGNEVLLSSTGTKFEYIGMLTISGNTFTTELIQTEDCQATDPEVDAYLSQINSDLYTLAEHKLAFSEVDLITKDADGNRLVRNTETNLGDLCADAMRYYADADVGYMNGGGIRADIPRGDITINTLLNVMPFNNTVVVAEISGQTMKDMLEMTVMAWPAEDGSFPHLSGITFSVNTSIPTSVMVNEQEEFLEVAGEYRVYDVKVYNQEKGTYEPLDLDGTYTIAASDYFLLDCGSGMTMFENARILRDDGILDVEVVEWYIVEMLNGVVGQQYQDTTPNITFSTGE